MATTKQTTDIEKKRVARDSSVVDDIQTNDVNIYSVTIRRPVEEVYAFFRDFENLPKFMKDLKSITIQSPKKSHWVVETKPGVEFEWDAEITAETPNALIAWKSLEGAAVQSEGEVTFRTINSKGTAVTLRMDVDLPGGKLAEWISFLTGDHPELLAAVNLRRLKALLETGNVPTIQGQPSGREESSETIVKH